ncbi:protein YIPF6 isoform X2 [Lingula anatina]|uniref:Protein YIPF n=1 Tax=Lingula anatina TaxID=7574 RepID=A0A1S3JBS3_LINAN|nr:protein YIPF6 isoform X2 [Lingula anatina]|eukprot:XP_013407334.1 protein YIPF6 isoform X2 [Lingula anatina]
MADVEFQQTHLNDVSLEGDITVPGAPGQGEDEDEEQPSTLDEPVRETVMRDLKAVGNKFFHVLYPKQSRALLQEWDLWGPLILCVILAMLLQSSDTVDKVNDGGPEFAEVFVIYWVGAVVVTLNTKLLGGSISFFQSICVLGYCALPLTLALIVCKLILLGPHTTAMFTVRCVTVLVAFLWSTFASTAFLTEYQLPNRKALAIYPIFLFYFVLSWLVVSHQS